MLNDCSKSRIFCEAAVGTLSRLNPMLAARKLSWISTTGAAFGSLSSAHVMPLLVADRTVPQGLTLSELLNEAALSKRCTNSLLAFVSQFAMFLKVIEALVIV